MALKVAKLRLKKIEMGKIERPSCHRRFAAQSTVVITFLDGHGKNPFSWCTVRAPSTSVVISEPYFSRQVSSIGFGPEFISFLAKIKAVTFSREMKVFVNFDNSESCEWWRILRVESRRSIMALGKCSKRSKLWPQRLKISFIPVLLVFFCFVKGKPRMIINIMNFLYKSLKAEVPEGSLGN